jgi:glycosyltransferase involved in cell wall biosynthesis
MLEAKRVAVVVPAHNEAGLIVATLQGIPGFVDRVYVVDDASTDETVERARSVDDPRVEVSVHEQTRGDGAAISTAYTRSAS